MRRAENRKRRGATLVESVITLTVFLVLILGMIDLGLGLFRFIILTEAARQGARQAIVHGSNASSAQGTWGPTTYSQPATDTGAIAQAIKPYLTGLDPSQVTITVTWLDGGTSEGNRVQVTVAYTYQPMTTFAISGTLPLSSSSTMPIAH
jgi:Flp pilus assembly protein TadG